MVRGLRILGSGLGGLGWLGGLRFRFRVQGSRLRV